MHRLIGWLLVAGCLATAAVPAGAQGYSSPGGLAGYSPRVPVSAFARPSSWFDASRFHVSTSVSVGTGFSGRTDALQVTRFSYDFSAPVWMSLSVGNAWGAAAGRNGSSLFLEGLDLGFRPHPSLMIQVHYRDFRTPLQYPASGLWGY